MQGSFAVDFMAASAAADLGIDEGCAYLALARHTAANNKTTTAGAQAISKALGVSRDRAGAFYRRLKSNLFFTMGKGTLITLETWPGIQSGGYTKRQREVIERLAHRKWIMSRADPDYQQANRLVKTGSIDRSENPEHGLFTALDWETDIIWLPNAFVDGLEGVASPLLRLREHRDKRLLLLALEVYQKTNMPEYCGIPWDHLCRTFDRIKVYQQGRFTIWGFQRENNSVWPGKFGNSFNIQGKGKMADFWNGLYTLERIGIVETVPYILESEALTAMPIMPYSIYGQGADLEQRIASSAHDAAERMTPDYVLESVEHDTNLTLHLCPVPTHITDVQMVGIYRPRYLAKTQRTAAWYANYVAPAERQIAAFNALGE